MVMVMVMVMGKRVIQIKAKNGMVYLYEVSLSGTKKRIT